MRTVKQTVFGMALLAAGTLAAQTAPPPPAATPELPRQQKVFVLKYADARHVADVLGVFGYYIRADRDLHVVAVSAPAEAMAAVEDAIKGLDVPAAAPKDINLVVYMVVASEHAAPSDLPAELQPIANQLSTVFSYKSFRLLDSILLRTQPGNRASTSGVIATGATPDAKTPYMFSVQPSAVTEDAKGRLIRLDNLAFSLSGTKRDSGINTEISVREGQRAVVGKSAIGMEGQALILVVSATVTE